MKNNKSKKDKIRLGNQRDFGLLYDILLSGGTYSDYRSELLDRSMPQERPLEITEDDILAAWILGKDEESELYAKGGHIHQGLNSNLYRQQFGGTWNNPHFNSTTTPGVDTGLQGSANNFSNNLGAYTLIISGVADVIGNSVGSARDIDYGKYDAYLNLIGNYNPGFSTDTSFMMNEWNQIPQFTNISYEDAGGHSGELIATNVGKSMLSGAAAGAALGSVVPVIGTAIGAVGGALFGGISQGIGEWRNSVNAKQNQDYINTIGDINAKLNPIKFGYTSTLANKLGILNQLSQPYMAACGGKMKNRLASGGYINSHYDYITDPLVKVNAGGTHQENPNEGVLTSIAPDGQPNLVEEGETIINNQDDAYVFSDRIVADDEILKSHLLPNKFAGKTYADISKELDKIIAEHKNDEISKRTFDEMISRLQQALEDQKFQEKQEEVEKFLDGLTDEQKEQLEQTMVEEAQAEQQAAEEQAIAEQQDQELAAQEQLMQPEQAPEQVAMEQPEEQIAPSRYDQMMSRAQFADAANQGMFGLGGHLHQDVYSYAPNSSYNHNYDGALIYADNRNWFQRNITSPINNWFGNLSQRAPEFEWALSNLTPVGLVKSTVNGDTDEAIANINILGKIGRAAKAAEEAANIEKSMKRGRRVFGERVANSKQARHNASVRKLHEFDDLYKEYGVIEEAKKPSISYEEAQKILGADDVAKVNTVKTEKGLVIQKPNKEATKATKQSTKSGKAGKWIAGLGAVGTIGAIGTLSNNNDELQYQQSEPILTDSIQNIENDIVSYYDSLYRANKERNKNNPNIFQPGGYADVFYKPKWYYNSVGLPFEWNLDSTVALPARPQRDLNLGPANLTGYYLKRFNEDNTAGNNSTTNLTTINTGRVSTRRNNSTLSSLTTQEDNTTEQSQIETIPNNLRYPISLDLFGSPVWLEDFFLRYNPNLTKYNFGDYRLTPPIVNDGKGNLFVIDRNGVRDASKLGFDYTSESSNDTSDKGSQDNTSTDWSTYLRYAPAIGSGIQYLSDLFGVTNRNDYTNPNLFQRSINLIPNVGFTPLGNYMTYSPLDEIYQQNVARSQYNAARRAIQNNASGNASAAIAAMDSLNGNMNNTFGDLALQAREYNDKQREAVEQFNANIARINSMMSLSAQEKNQAIAAEKAKLTYNLANMRENIQNMNDAAKSANENTFYNNLGAIGKENFNMQMVRTNPAFYYTIMSDGSIVYKNSFYDLNKGDQDFITADAEKALKEQLKKNSEDALKKSDDMSSLMSSPLIGRYLSRPGFWNGYQYTGGLTNNRR